MQSLERGDRGEEADRHVNDKRVKPPDEQQKIFRNRR